MKRVTIFSLVLCLLLSVFASCSDDAAKLPESSEESLIASAEVSSEDSSAEEAYDMQGRRFNTMQRWFGHNVKYIDFTGEVLWADSENGELTEIDLAKKQVLDKVQKELNCTVTGEISTKTPSEIRSFIEADLLSGAPTIDFCFETYYYYYAFTENGYLADLISLGLDTGADWWDSGAMKDLTIGGKLYYAFGDINTYDNGGTYVVLFNKRLYAEKYGDVSALYSLAKDGGFTFDVLKEKTLGFGHDDTYGLLSHSHNVYVHLMAAGERMVGKDDKDMPVFVIDNERAFKVHDDVGALYTSSNDVLLYYNFLIGIENPPDITLDAFKEGRGLFYITTLSRLPQLEDMEDEYGILPMPKYNSEQDSYYHCVDNASAVCAFVPQTALSEGQKGKEIGILLDTLGKYSKEYLTPVYVKSVAPDSDSESIVETVLSTRIYDLASVYSVVWGDPLSICLPFDKSMREQIDLRGDELTSQINITVNKLNGQEYTMR